MIEKTKTLDSFKLEEDFFSIMSVTIDACRKARIFMVGIYSFEKSSFLYANDKLVSNFGENYNRLHLEGWDAWYDLIQLNEREHIQKRISNFIDSPIKLARLKLRYHISLDGGSIYLMHEIVVRELEGLLVGVNYFLDISEKKEIERSLGIVTKKEESTYLQQTLSNLSPRQSEILQLISDGYTSKEIANLLHISNHTVLTHRKNLIEKFAVKNTAQLIKKAWSGILS